MTDESASRARSQSLRFAVVSWSGAVPIHLSPRGQRTAHLVHALSRYGAIERVGGSDVPQWLNGDWTRVSGSSWYRRLAHRLMASVMVDKYELGAWRALRSWAPDAHAAVLVGYPWSPLYFAADTLARLGIPYIVDVGDPWILTNPYPDGGRLMRRRAARCERRLWESARGAVVTTHGQGEALEQLFPHLRILVRPNGYTTYPRPLRTASFSAAAASNKRDLRLVHYGSLHGARVNFQAMLGRLASSGRWDKVTLFQYGADWEGALASVPRGVAVEHNAPIPWERVLAEAHTFDAAVVLGWRNSGQMPSKTVQYLTLPIPRIAMVSGARDDALAAYVSNRPGWAVIAEGSEMADIVGSHLARSWESHQLCPPASESWEAVEHVLGAFAFDTIVSCDARQARGPHSRPPMSGVMALDPK
jgi:hypothetical protein